MTQVLVLTCVLITYQQDGPLGRLKLTAAESDQVLIPYQQDGPLGLRPSQGTVKAKRLNPLSAGWSVRTGQRVQMAKQVLSCAATKRCFALRCSPNYQQDGPL